MRVVGYRRQVSCCNVAKDTRPVVEIEAVLLSQPVAQDEVRVTISIDVVEGELALAVGQPQQAVELLEPAVRKLLPSGFSSYFMGAETLARAHLALGDTEGARRVLEDASNQRLRAVGGRGKLFWLNLRWQLAKILRDEGQIAKAEEIEDELRRLTALADRDFWLVDRLANVQ